MAVEPTPLRLIVSDPLDSVVAESPAMWHVTISLAGQAVPIPRVAAALEQLSDRHPFLMDASYATDRAEIRYWEEAADLPTALHFAAKFWPVHRQAAGLGDWEAVGVEVVDRSTLRDRLRWNARSVISGGNIAPFPGS